MLSYSTNGSGAGASVDKVKQGYEIYKSTLAHKYTKTDVFGEIQFDAAYVDSVRSKKASNLNWNSGANVYIFPQLDSGNISYKMMQRWLKDSKIFPGIIQIWKKTQSVKHYI